MHRREGNSPANGGAVTVVRRDARRRWLVVLAVVAVLCSLPVAVAAWPARAPTIPAEVLRERMLASAGQPYQGYAQSAGSMGLPELPRLGQVTALLSGTTQMRAWYAGRDRWRVDVLGAGTERGLYQTSDGQYVWDYGDNQLTRIVGEQPARLPRAPDLIPPDLARRLLGTATGDRVAALAAKRVAGIAAAGLRITPADPHTTVRHVDIWADPATGLPLQAEITGRGMDRPVLITRFLEVTMGAPAADVLAPPDPRPGVGFTVTRRLDVVSALDQALSGRLPDRLAGQPRGDAVSGVSTVGVYGTGLARFVVLPLPGGIGYEAYTGAVRWGRRVTLPDGDGALITTALLSVLVVDSGTTGRTYLLAGLVDAALLQQAGAALAGFQA